MIDELLVAFDIGASKISAAVAKVDDLKDMHVIAVTSVDNYGISKSVVSSMEEIVESISKCKNKLEELIGFSISEAYLSIHGGLCEIVDSKGSLDISGDGRLVTSKDIENLRNSTKQISLPADKEIIWLSPVHYISDNYEDMKEPVGFKSKAIALEAKLFVVNSLLLARMKECMELADIKVKDVIPQPVALKGFIDERGNEIISAGIIDIGAETIDLSVYEKGCICYTKHIPLGGNSITRDLSVCLNVSFADAEKIKRRYNKKLPDDEVVSNEEDKLIQISKDKSGMIQEIIEARVDELLTFALDELNSVKNLLKFDCFYITGSGILHYQSNIDSFSKEMDKPITSIKDSFSEAEDSIYCVPIGVLREAVASMVVNKNQTEKLGSLSKDDNRSTKSIITKLKQFIEDFL